MAAIYVARTRPTNAASYGTMILHRDAQSADWIGAYTRPEIDNDDAIESGTLTVQRVRWTRTKPPAL